MPTLNINGNILTDTVANWTANATVYSGKTMLVSTDVTYTGTDQRKWKLANGTDTWANLDYFPVSGDVVVVDLAPVISQINNPPVAVAGDRYLIDTAPTGAWVGNANNVAEWDGAAWVYTVAVLDNVVFITNTLTTKRFNGTSWVAYTGTAILQNGNSLGSSVRIGSRDNQTVFLQVNNIATIRIGGSTNAIIKPTVFGSVTTHTPVASSIVELRSTSQGFLVPRMTSAQKNAIASPATGLQVFDTDMNCLDTYDGTKWTAYRKYRPFLTQAGVGDPSATLLENTLSGVPVWVRDGAAGSYKATLTGEFTIGKTVIIPPAVGNATTVFAVEANYSVNEIYLTSYDGGVAQDDLMGNGISFEIRVYQ